MNGECAKFQFIDNFVSLPRADLKSEENVHILLPRVGRSPWDSFHDSAASQSRFVRARRRSFFLRRPKRFDESSFRGWSCRFSVNRNVTRKRERERKRNILHGWIFADLVFLDIKLQSLKAESKWLILLFSSPMAIRRLVFEWNTPRSGVDKRGQAFLPPIHRPVYSFTRNNVADDLSMRSTSPEVNHARFPDSRAFLHDKIEIEKFSN